MRLKNANKSNDNHRGQFLAHLLYPHANNPTKRYLVYGHFCSLYFHTLTIDKRKRESCAMAANEPNNDLNLKTKSDESTDWKLMGKKYRVGIKYSAIRLERLSIMYLHVF